MHLALTCIHLVGNGHTSPEWTPLDEALHAGKNRYSSRSYRINYNKVYCCLCHIEHSHSLSQYMTHPVSIVEHSCETARCSWMHSCHAAVHLNVNAHQRKEHAKLQWHTWYKRVLRKLCCPGCFKIKSVSEHLTLQITASVIAGQ